MTSRDEITTQPPNASARIAPTPRAPALYDAALLGTIGLVAALFVRLVLWRYATLEQGVPTPDVYAAQYPMLVHAWRSLWRGHGLLWTSLQNAGQPFLPSTLTAPLYPLNLLFLPFGLLAGYPILAAVHLTIGSGAVFLLCREYGTGRSAALGGAFTFLLSWVTVALAVWMPTVILGAYVWMPVALLLLERSLRAPGPAHAIGLALALAIQLLAGFPQISLFTYQLLGLRILWQVASRRDVRRVRTLAWIAFGLVLPTALAAVYLLPGVEFAAQSIRNHPLALNEMRLSHQPTWETFRRHLNPPGGLRRVSVLPLVLAVVALASRQRRATAVFFVAVMCLYVALIFDNPIFHHYIQLPLARTFRDPTRFLWIVFFAVAVLCGLGIEGSLDPRASPARIRTTALLATAIGGYLYAWLTLFTRAPLSYAALMAMLIALLLASVRPWGARLAAGAIPVLVLWNLYTAVGEPFLRYVTDDRPFITHAGVYDSLRLRMASQDRFLTFASPGTLGLQVKAPSLVDLPTPFDYEPQTSHRLATYWVRMRSGRQMSNINDYLYTGSAPVVASRPLFDLLAIRYVVIDPTFALMERVFDPPLEFLSEENGLRVYVNRQALPRAYFVPRVQVVDDANLLLTILAERGVDPSRVALLEAPPQDGFLGPDGGRGTVSLEDRSEQVAVEVDAATAGFVVLTDQYYPGWSVTVNGARADLLRANYQFRAVRVPAGHSTVRFRYLPLSLVLGGVLSLVSGAALVAYAGIVVRRRRRATVQREPRAITPGA